MVLTIITVFSKSYVHNVENDSKLSLSTGTLLTNTGFKMAFKKRIKNINLE